MSLKSSMKNAFLQGAHNVGLNHLAHRVHPRSIVLMYHGVVPDDFPIDCWTFVRQNEYRRQMEYLVWHYDVMPVSTALECAQKGIPRKRPVALVTFDDGYRNNYLWACPVMKDLNLPFTVFVVSDFVDAQTCFWFDEVIMAIQAAGWSSLDLRGWGLGSFEFPQSDPESRWNGIQRLLTRLKMEHPGKRMHIAADVSSRGRVSDEISRGFRIMSSQDLSDMASTGLVEIGSHTSGHEILTDLDHDEIVNTVSRSVNTLGKLIGVEPRYFSYPNGNYNEAIKEIVAQCGLHAAFITGSRHWGMDRDIYAIPRVGIGGYDSHWTFAAKVSGLLAQVSIVKKALSRRSSD